MPCSFSFVRVYVFQLLSILQTYIPAIYKHRIIFPAIDFAFTIQKKNEKPSKSYLIDRKSEYGDDISD